MNSQEPIWIYVAGPYTHPDPIANTRAAILAGEAIQAAGATAIVPHLSALWHLVSPHDVEHWYAYDLELLKRCDALLRLPGASVGADREVAAAQAAGLPVWAMQGLLLAGSGEVTAAAYYLLDAVHFLRRTASAAERPAR